MAGYLVVWLSSGNWLELAVWRGLLVDYLNICLWLAISRMAGYLFSRAIWLWIGYLNVELAGCCICYFCPGTFQKVLVCFVLEYSRDFG